MKKTMYKVTWGDKVAFVGSTYYMGAIQKAAEMWGVKPREISGTAKVEVWFEFESINK